MSSTASSYFSPNTTNAYLSALTAELLSLCLQHTSSSGNLSTGGLGVWTYLMYQNAVLLDPYEETTEKVKILSAARDAGLEALYNPTGEGGTELSGFIGSFDNALPAFSRREEKDGSDQSVSIFTNPLIGTHSMLAAIFYQLQTTIPNASKQIQIQRQLQECKGKVNHHVQSVLEIIQKSVNISSLDTAVVDASLWTGMAGAMQTIYFLRQHTHNPHLGQSLVVDLAKQLLLRGRKTARKFHRVLIESFPHGQTMVAPSLLWGSTGTYTTTNSRWKYDLSAQYGLIGILTTLLALCEEEWELLENVSEFDVDADVLRNSRALVKQTIDAMSQNGSYSTSGIFQVEFDNVLQDVDRQLSFSHGAAGHVLLLLGAHQVFGDVSYLSQAHRLAEEVLWARRTLLARNGLGLMTGITGNAYVLMHLSRVLSSTKGISESHEMSVIWKQRSEQMVRHAVQHWRELLATQQMHAPYSLMTGLGGVVALLMDLNKPIMLSPTQFPLFYQRQSVSWPERGVLSRLMNPTPTMNTTKKGDCEGKNDFECQQTTTHDRTQSPGRCHLSSTLSKNMSMQVSKEMSMIASSPTETPVLCNTSERIKVVHNVFTKVESWKGHGDVSESIMSQSDGLPDAKLPKLQISSDNLVDCDRYYSKHDDAFDSGLLDEQRQKEQSLSKEMTSVAELTPDNRSLKSQISGNIEHKVTEAVEKADSGNHTLLDEESHKAAMNKNPYEDYAHEFHDPRIEDVPDERFLRLQDSSSGDRIDNFYEQDGTALNPRILDEERHTVTHQKQKNGIASEYEFAGVPDFAYPHQDEAPNEAFLQIDPESERKEYYELGCNLLNHSFLDAECHPESDIAQSSLELVDSGGIIKMQVSVQDNKNDEELLRMQDSNEASDSLYQGANEDKGLRYGEDVVKDNQQIIVRAREEMDSDNFKDVTINDMPNENDLRGQDAGDEMYFEYYEQENSAMLDNEGQDEQASKPHRRYSGEWSMSDEEFSQQDFNMQAYKPPVPRSASELGSDLDVIPGVHGADDSEVANVSDEHNSNFLCENMSSDSLIDANGYHQQEGGRLDDDGRETIGIHLTAPKSRIDDVGEFGETHGDEVADSGYLSRQDSCNDVYFDHDGDQERLLNAKQNVRLLAKEAATKAISKVFSTPMTPSKMNGRMAEFKSPARGTPASTATSKAAKAASSSPDAKTNSHLMSSMDLANLCFDRVSGEGSLLNGGLGIAAYLRIKLSRVETDSAKAQEYLEAALKYTQIAVDDSRFDDGGKKYLSVISNDAIGSRCLLACALWQLGKCQEAIKVGDEVISELRKLYESDEKRDCSVLFGLSGALQAIWFLRNELDNESIGSDLALTVSSTIILRGLENDGKYQTSSPLVWEWHDRPFLGAGTGAVGILYTILGLNEEEWNHLDECLPGVFGVIRQCIDCLSEQTMSSGNLKASIDGYEEDKSTDWTHGAPGYCLLLLRAYEVYSDSKYLNQANHIADLVIWPRRMQRRGVGLSRGVAGVAYTLLALANYDTDNSTVWKFRASRMAELAVADLEELELMSKHPMSLFEGTGGLASLLIDLEKPTLGSWFPFFGFSSSSQLHKNTHHYSNETEERSIRDSRIPKRLHINTSSVGIKPNNPLSKTTLSDPNEAEGNAVLFNAETVTTAATGSDGTQYRTPPRPTNNAVVSPITQSSLNSSKLSPAATRLYSPTKAKLRMRRQIEEQQMQNGTKRDHLQTPSPSPNTYPSRVRRCIYTHPDPLPLADRPTQSWLAKHIHTDVALDNTGHFDVFISEYIERRLRAETSWKKQNEKV